MGDVSSVQGRAASFRRAPSELDKYNRTTESDTNGGGTEIAVAMI